MPWKVGDVDGFKKGLSDSEKERWVAIANSALSACLKDGGDQAECERKAIMQASGVLKKQQEVDMPDLHKWVEALQGAERLGAGKDDPEGARYIQMSETLVAELIADLQEMTWTAAYINTLPDSSFAIILPGGEQDDEGKTTPRSLRKLPYKDAEGKVDIPHLQNALARAPQMTDVSAEQKAAAIRKLQAVAKEHLKSYQKEMEIVALALSLAESYVEPEPEGDDLAESTFAESGSGYAIGLAEVAEDNGNRAPVEFDLKIITPGAGNSRDKHWYPADMLKRDAHVFEGVDMFVTDHRESERSERTKVGKIKSIIGFTEDGGPIGRAVIFDPDMAEKTRNRAAAGELETLHCSILANGTAKKGKVDGVQYHIVEAISSASAVDLVSRAGAGGRALALAESENGGEPMDEEQVVVEEQEEQLEEVTLQEQQGEEPQPEEQPPAPAMLAQERVLELVGESNLPDASKARLSETGYPDEGSVGVAIKKEIAYLKEVMGSGKPFAQGAGDPPPEHRPRTVEEADADFKRILAEVGMPHLGG